MTRHQETRNMIDFFHLCGLRLFDNDPVKYQYFWNSICYGVQNGIEVPLQTFDISNNVPREYRDEYLNGIKKIMKNPSKN